MPHHPELETPRLRLRHFVAADLAAVFAALSHPQVIAHYGVSYPSLPACQTQMDWYAAIQREGSGLWLAIEARAGGSMIGAIGINDLSSAHHCAEFGYWLLPDYWGQGLMREAATAFIPYAYRQLRLNRLLAVVEEPNLRSIHLLRVLGFRHEGLARECEFKNGHYLSLHHYSLLRSEALSLPATVSLQQQA